MVDRDRTFRARISRHEQAVIQAEARRLARALAPYRVLPRQTLERVAGASRWHDGGFDSALAAAVRAGEIEELPSGFYRECGRRPGDAAATETGMT